MTEETKKLVEEIEARATNASELIQSRDPRLRTEREAARIRIVRSDVPKLCAEVRRLDEENERLRAQISNTEAVTRGVVAVRVSSKKRPCFDCNDIGFVEVDEGPNRGGFVPCSCGAYSAPA